jgi:hypothetical protein
MDDRGAPRGKGRRSLAFNVTDWEETLPKAVESVMGSLATAGGGQIRRLIAQCF